MGGAESSSCLGIHFGTKITIVVLVFTTVYLGLSLAFSLVARLYLRTYYTAAHAAALSVFIALFVISHHILRIQRLLGIPKTVYAVIQTILNLWILCCMLVAAIGYTVLFVLSANTNIDYLAALLWAWMDIGILLYLLMLGISIATASRKESYNTGGYSETTLDDFMMTEIDIDALSGKGKKLKKGACVKCLIILTRCIFGLLYFIGQILFMVAFILTAYNVAATWRDFVKYRDNETLYSVKVWNHKPLAIDMKCIGSGAETVIIENDLGSSTYVMWNFLPQNLAARGYRVCVYDRRGYGWSESYETDDGGILKKEPQWPKTNVDFLKALVDEANIAKPFFYVGYGYGGQHVVYMELKYPEYLKGLIFLDAFEYSTAEDLQILEAFANFLPTGAIRFIIDTGLYDYDEAFSAYIAANSTMNDEMVASQLSGLTLYSMWREWSETDEAERNLTKELSLPSSKIYKPTLVIDAENGKGYSFYEPNFPYFKPSNSYHVVWGSNHKSIFLSHEHSETVSHMISDFIQNLANNTAK